MFHFRVHPPLLPKKDKKRHPLDVALEDRDTLIRSLRGVSVSMSAEGHKDVKNTFEDLYKAGGKIDPGEFAQRRDSKQKDDYHKAIGKVENAFVGKDNWVYASVKVDEGKHLQEEIIKGNLFSSASISHYEDDKGITVLELSLCRDPARKGCNLVSSDKCPISFMAEKKEISAAEAAFIKAMNTVPDEADRKTMKEYIGEFSRRSKEAIAAREKEIKERDEALKANKEITDRRHKQALATSRDLVKDLVKYTNSTMDEAQQDTVAETLLDNEPMRQLVMASNSMFNSHQYSSGSKREATSSESAFEPPMQETGIDDMFTSDLF